MKNLFRLIQFSDSAFPVGAFSFSNGLETAAHIGLVHDAATLKSYTAGVARQAAFSDGIACLIAFRAAKAGDYPGVINTDKQLMMFKMNNEARLMLARMGKKMAELGVRLYGKDSLFGNWLADINAGKCPGTFPVAQAIAFACDGQNEQSLYASHQYGVINMVLSAALRLLRVSHYDTQQILFDLSQNIELDYEQAKTMNLEDMNSFVPQMDILASMHEKGQMRLFIN